MKILLFGEFSGVHTNLKTGLQNLGIDVQIACNGDGWKGFKSDFYMGSNQKSFAGKLSKAFFPIFTPIYNVRNWQKYDVVQLINPFALFDRYLKSPFGKLIANLLSSKTNLIFLGCGCDSQYIKYNRFLQYSPCKTCKEIDLKSERCRYEETECIDFNKFMIDKARTIIPVSWDYDMGYKQLNYRREKLIPIIPMPVDIDSIQFKEIAKKDRILIYHPLNREGFKGTNIILEAFKELRRKYKNVDFISNGKMPINEYLEFLGKVDVVIDQVNSYADGMNSLYSMAMGKVVMSGLENEVRNSQYEFYNQSPVINIKPDVQFIVNKISELLEDKSKIKEIGLKSRQHIEKYHDCNKVAAQYLEVYKRFCK